MSINVKEFIKKKNMKMSKGDVSDVVSKYIMKIELEQLVWTLEGFYQSLDSVVQYYDSAGKESYNKSDDTYNKTKIKTDYNEISYKKSKKYSDNYQLKNLNQYSGELAA